MFVLSHAVFILSSGIDTGACLSLAEAAGGVASVALATAAAAGVVVVFQAG